MERIMGLTEKNIGGKFQTDGSFRPFPGNTIISMLNHEKEAFQHFLVIRALYEASPAAPCLTLLPLSSIHMTVIEGVCDQVRKPELWTSKLPLDCPLSQVDDLFEERFKTVKPLGEVHMKMTHMVPDIAILMRMEPATAQDAAELKRYRNDMSEALGVRFPNHDDYRFHMTLGYFTKEPSAEQTAALEKFYQDADAYIAGHNIEMRVEQPLLTFFDDMSCFVPHRIPRKA